MRTFLVAAVLLALIPGLAPAQSLAHCVSGDVLVYFRSDHPWDELSNMGLDALLGDMGTDVQEQMLATIDEALAGFEEMAGISTGSVGTYIKSITAIEAVIYGIELTESIPEIDFALVISSPQTDPIYKLASGLLQKQEMGYLTEEGDTEIDFMGLYEAIMGHKNDKLVISNDAGHLRDVLNGLGTVKAGCLAQSKDFKALVGGTESASCFYARLQPFLRMLREELPRDRLDELNAYGGPLGLWKLSALGYMKDEQRSSFGIRGEGTIPAFEMLADSKGDPKLLAAVPQDTVFAMSWSGDVGTLWRKTSGFFLDPARFPQAGRTAELVRAAQKTIGVTFEDLAAVAEDGAAFGWIPTEGNREEEGLFAVIGTPDAGQAAELAAKILESVGRRRGLEVTTSESDGATWHEIMRKDRLQGVVAISDDAVVLGQPEIVSRVLQARRGDIPTLGRTGALKGLPARSSGFMALNAASFMNNVLQMKPGEEGGKPKTVGDLVAGSSFDVTESSLMFRSNRAFSDLLGLMAVSGMFLARAEAIEYELEEGEAQRVRIAVSGEAGVGIGPPEIMDHNETDTRPSAPKKEPATPSQKAKPAAPTGPGKE